ncbi:MAG: PQQ-like beta-propeller repeat protein, partial [Planctomycetales bacterium]
APFLATPASAQFPLAPRTLSNAIDVDSNRDNVVETHLNLVRANLKNLQWAEALDTLQQVMENHGERLIALPEESKHGSRYVSVRDFCHRQIRGLPKEARRLYRDRVDPQASKWFEEGVARRKPELLRKIVDHAFVSSWTDDALLVLGDLALGRGDYHGARTAWRGILPPGELGALSAASESGRAYPDTDLPLSDVRARLILVSILEGSADRANRELAEFQGQFPDATGKLGGKTGKHADLLAELLADSKDWETPSPNRDWTTFAGGPARTWAAPRRVVLAGKRWEFPLPPVKVANPLIHRARNLHRAAARNHEYFNYHPVISGDTVLFQQRSQEEPDSPVADEIIALGLQSGKVLWKKRFENPALAHVPTLGVPRFTMTVHGRRLFARVGPLATNSGQAAERETPRSKLVCLDLRAEGKLVWEIDSGSDGWSFDGAPVTDGESIYAALRRGGPRPKSYVACHDADTGRRRWLRFVCSAAVWASEGEGEITNNLLTLHQDRVFFNTNLGAVAALSARDGHIHWLTTYPRETKRDLTRPRGFHFRDVTPCVYHQGILFAAPIDTPDVLALDAETGEIHWRREFPNIIHLLGVGGGNLIASGDRMYWIDIHA